jgi:hypothetical protein
MDRGSLNTLVQAAVLAPSSHNTQPWLFRIRDDTVDLIADRTRALPVNDPNDRELTISCGCALFNLRVMAAALAQRADIEICPDPQDEDLLARVRLTRSTETESETTLASMIPLRRTYRQRFDDVPVAADTIAALAAAVRAEGAHLDVLASPAQRESAAELIARADTFQWSDPRWRRELAAWMHSRRRHDGLAMPALAVPLAQLVVLTFDMGGGVGAKDRELATHSPLLALVSTSGDSCRDWLATGQALQRALLTGVQRGLQASYLNQPIQVETLRPRLRELFGGARFPQLLMRWGHASRTLPASPRRPLADVVLQD